MGPDSPVIRKVTNMDLDDVKTLYASYSVPELWWRRTSASPMGRASSCTT